MQQFFIENIENPALSKEQRHQVEKVLRMKKGSQVRLVDHNGQGGVFQFLDDSLLELNIIEKIEFPKKNYSLKIVASLIRTERLEWMIQKACESGVDEIVLYASDHGVVRDFGKRSERKLERLNMIALEACEQAYRQYPVTVRGIITKQDIKSEMSDINVIADLGDRIHVIDAVSPNRSITALIGPEGGFSDHEHDVFNNFGFVAVSLGKNVYRAETASIALSNFVSLLDR